MGSNPIVLNCIAQLVEQRAFNSGVLGSSPSACNINRLYLISLMLNDILGTNLIKSYNESLTIIFNDKFFIGVYLELFLIFCISGLIAFIVILDYIYKYKILLIQLTLKILLFIIFLAFLILNNNINTFYTFDYLLIQDSFSIFVKNIILFSLFLSIIISYDYIKIERIFQYEYFILVGIALLGLLTMVSSNDLITLYLAIELQSLSFYILAAIKVFSNFSTEAGLKYFILGAFSSGILLFGCSLIYGFCGTTNLSDLKFLFLDSDYSDNLFWGLLLGSLFVTVGILFKLGAAPFHMWLPDVYDGVPTSVTALYAIVPKIAIFSLFLRLSQNFFTSNFFFWQQILVICAILSMLIGTLGALYQIKLKKLLAYSAISHIGFLLIGFSNLTIWGLFAMFFYIFVYILISINIFSIVLSLRKLDNNLKLKKINEFVVLFKSNVLLAVNFSIILFSIAGIPPLLGFYSKFYVFTSVIKSQVYLLAIIAAIFSVLASMYYIRLIKLMFFKNINFWFFCYEISKTNSIIISLTFFFNILFFCYPQPILMFLYKVILEFDSILYSYILN